MDKALTQLEQTPKTPTTFSTHLPSTHHPYNSTKSAPSGDNSLPHVK